MSATTIRFHGAAAPGKPVFFVGRHGIPWPSIGDAIRSGAVVVPGGVARARIFCVQDIGGQFTAVATIEGVPAPAGPFPWCAIATGLMGTVGAAARQAPAMIADIEAAPPEQLRQGSVAAMRALAERLPSPDIAPYAVRVMAAWVRRAGCMEPAAAAAVLATSAARDLAVATRNLKCRGQLDDIAVVVGAAVAASGTAPTRVGLAAIDSVLDRQAGPPTRLSRVDATVVAGLRALKTWVQGRLANGAVFD